MTRSDPHVSSGFRLPAAYKASFSADDAKLVMLCSDVVVWDVAKRLKRYRVHPLTHPSHCDVEPRGKHVAIKSTAGIVLTLDIRDGAVAQVIDDGTQGEGTNILYSPCSNFIVDGTWSGGLTVREVASGKVAFERRREGETIHRICARVARKRWVVHHGIKYPSERPDYVTAWTWPFRRPKCFEIGHDVISSLAISPDGKHFVTCGPCRKKASRVTVRSTADGGVVVEAKIDQCELVTQIA